MLLMSVALYAQNPQSILKKYKCTECHDLKKRQKAPLFKKIAKKNLKWYDSEDKAKVSMKKSIKEGTRGKYKYYESMKMPANKKISDSEMDTVVRWILSIQNKSHKKSVF